MLQSLGLERVRHNLATKQQPNIVANIQKYNLILYVYLVYWDLLNSLSRFRRCFVGSLGFLSRQASCLYGKADFASFLIQMHFLFLL